MNEENIKYQILDYDKYQKRLEAALQNDDLLKLNIQKKVLGYTKYGYEIADYSVGFGAKDLFIVGGSHGSEIIGVDFVTQFLNNIPSLENYDPSLITIHIIPSQNPEGFDITTQMIKSIEEDKIEQESYDYYIRYRLDNMLNNYINKLNNLFDSIEDTLITPSVYIDTIKKTFKEDYWLNLIEPKRGVPDLITFASIIYGINNLNSYDELQSELLIKVNNAINFSNNIYFKLLI